MEEQVTGESESLIDPRRFLHHDVLTHQKQQHLFDTFKSKSHWIFAMTTECVDVAIRMGTLHHERTGEHIEMVPVCCLKENPAFFLFPREHLAYYEIDLCLNIEVSSSKEVAENTDYFTVSKSDPKLLNILLEHWLHRDALTN